MPEIFDIIFCKAGCHDACNPGLESATGGDLAQNVEIQIGNVKYG